MRYAPLRKERQPVSDSVRVTIGRDTDGRDDYCHRCGRPFDLGDKAYAVPDEWGKLYCSTACVDEPLYV